MDKKIFVFSKGNKGNKDLNTRWYIQWYVIDLLTGKNIRKRRYIYDYPTVTARETAGEALIAELSGQSFGWKGKYSTLVAFLSDALEETAAYHGRETHVIYKNYFKNYQEYILKHNSYLVAGFINYLVELQYAPTTINQHIALLKMLFKTLIKKKLITENPCDEIRKLKERREHGKIFSLEQKNLLKQTFEKIAPELILPVKYQFYCLIRPRKELRLLRVRDINLTDGTIRISASNAKDAEQRIVNIPELFCSELKRLRVDLFPDEYFLVGKHGLPAAKCVGKNYFYKKHDVVLKRLNLKGFYFYSWKHTGNFFAQQNGIPVKELQLHNGHSDLRTTDNYLGSMRAVDCPNIRTKYPEF